MEASRSIPVASHGASRHGRCDSTRRTRCPLECLTWSSIPSRVAPTRSSERFDPTTPSASVGHRWCDPTGHWLLLVVCEDARKRAQSRLRVDAACLQWTGATSLAAEPSRPLRPVGRFDAAEWRATERNVRQRTDRFKFGSPACRCQRPERASRRRGRGRTARMQGPHPLEVHVAALVQAARAVRELRAGHRAHARAGSAEAVRRGRRAPSARPARAPRRAAPERRPEGVVRVGRADLRGGRATEGTTGRVGARPAPEADRTIGIAARRHGRAATTATTARNCPQARRSRGATWPAEGRKRSSGRGARSAPRAARPAPIECSRSDPAAHRVDT